jgi:signal transduction histidine kinase/CheY-like chemotaxis protein
MRRPRPHAHDPRPQLALLADASARLGNEPGPDAVLARVLEYATRLLEADASALWRRAPDAARFRAVASIGLPPDARLDAERDAVPSEPTIVDETTTSPSHRETLRADGFRVLLEVPLRIRGEAPGALGFYFRRARRVEPTEVQLAAALAGLAASAIGDAEALEHQRRLRAEAEAAQARLAFLAEASAQLGASLDPPTMLAHLTRLAVPRAADWCAVDLVVGEGALQRVAAAYADPQRADVVRELGRRFPLDPARAPALDAALRQEQSLLVPEVDPADLAGYARDAEHLALLRALGLRSVLIVPMVARGRALGLITLATAESGRRYVAADLAMAEDLARRVALAVDNARLYQEARAASRAKDEFLATLSHELRTPLTTMIGWARLLRTGTLEPAKATRALEAIERSAQTQARLIGEILDVSRIVTGRMVLDVRPVALRPVIEAALAAARPAADARGVRVETAFDPAAPPVAGDPDRLQQVVWNLISNAIKFTPGGGRVEVALERRGPEVAVRVTDTGVGIDPAFLPHVFERFRQADGTVTRVHGGLGLGLAVVKHLVELHGGTVHAESAGRGQGASFTVLLPARALPAESTAPGEGVPEARQRVARLAGVRVLAADDDADTREWITTLLEQHGARVTAVATEAEALAALERETPHVLLSDVSMPDDTGFALIRRVRERGPARGGDVPAAALTAWARDENRREVFEAGFQLHVTKPVDPDELVDAVALLAAQARGRGAAR